MDDPREDQLARAVVDRRALTRVSDGAKLDVDLSLVMTGFTFEQVYSVCRAFVVGSVEIPVAKLSHILESKAKAGRAKDRLFLATHADALRRLLADDAKPTCGPEGQT